MRQQHLPGRGRHGREAAAHRQVHRHRVHAGDVAQHDDLVAVELYPRHRFAGFSRQFDQVRPGMLQGRVSAQHGPGQAHQSRRQTIGFRARQPLQIAQPVQRVDKPLGRAAAQPGAFVQLKNRQRLVVAVEAFQHAHRLFHRRHEQAFVHVVLAGDVVGGCGGGRKRRGGHGRTGSALGQGAHSVPPCDAPEIGCRAPRMSGRITNLSVYACRENAP
ncbi:hypothetical protein D3C72_939230 [compost metagenome]